MCEITLQFYGVLAEIAGTRQTHLKNHDSLEKVKDHVHRQYPEMRKHNFIYAVNNRIASGNQDIGNGSTVALMPPFSGG